MQSLGQAVYRFICRNSREGGEGVGKRVIVEEMASRGYVEPLKERVEETLQHHLTSDFIALRGRHYVKHEPYWRQSESSATARIGRMAV